MRDYLTFQFVLGDATLFAGIRKVLPGHYRWRTRRRLGRDPHRAILGTALPARPVSHRGIFRRAKCAAC